MGDDEREKSYNSLPAFEIDNGQLIALAHLYSDREGTALFYSGGRFDSAKRSFLFLFPSRKIVLESSKDPWKSLESKLASGKPWVGYLGYELGAFSDPDIILPYLKAETPLALFYQPNLILEIDHSTRQAYCKYSLEPDFLNPIDAIKFEALYKMKDWKELLLKPTVSANGNIHSRLIYQSDSPKSYESKIHRIKEQIRSGNVYQLNLSQEFHFETTSFDPFSAYLKIIESNPAPFTAFINCGDFFVISSSPERFLSKKGSTLETRPIKGTHPRGKNLEEDKRNQENLLSSEKERSELLMITDLMRNDLGKVSLPGTVEVEDIWRCEAYTNVFHLISIIKGIVNSNSSPIALLKSLFPGGSITGCPKLRAIQWIHELEERPRGIYTGSIGYIDECGDFDFNIAIRTLIVFPRKHHYKVCTNLGGGIVIDSDPQKEYEETLHKGKTLFSILNSSLLDSAWSPS